MRTITNKLPLDRIDHDELLNLLERRYQTCWRVSPQAIAFPASAEFALQVNFKGGHISNVDAGPALSDGALSELLQHIETKLLAVQPTAYGRDILFAHRPVTGSFRFQSAPMQILPPPARAPRPPQTLAEHPFVLEFPFDATAVPQLRTMRLRRNTVQWARVLNALLDGRIRHSSAHPRQLWAVKGRGSMRPSWQQEFYIVPGYRHIVARLSPQRKTRIAVVPADKYRSGWRGLAPLINEGKVPLDKFYIPSDLDQLVDAYLKLDDAQRERFIRSATAIYLSREVWESSISSSFLACVQAIEALTDRPPTVACSACGLDTSEGPTKRVKAIIKKFCGNMDVDERVLNNLYGVRSAIAHGSALFQIDEAPWLFGTAFSVANYGDLENIDAAVSVAKKVLQGWLLAQVK